MLTPGISVQYWPSVFWVAGQHVRRMLPTMRARSSAGRPTAPLLSCSPSAPFSDQPLTRTRAKSSSLTLQNCNCVSSSASARSGKRGAYIRSRCGPAGQSLARPRRGAEVAARVVEHRLGLRGVPILARLADVRHAAVELRLGGALLDETGTAPPRQVPVDAGVVGGVHREDRVVDLLEFVRRVGRPIRS